MTKQTRTWIVAAEAARARIFLQPRPGAKLEELTDLVNPAARTKQGKLVSDKPGRTFDSKGAGRHAKSPKESLKKQEEDKFARDICERINAARGALEFDKLVLVAAPQFLGLLRQHLEPEAVHQVSREIHKNLVREDAETIRSQIVA